MPKSQQNPPYLSYLKLFFLLGSAYLVAYVFYPYLWPTFAALVLYVIFLPLNTHLYAFFQNRKGKRWQTLAYDFAAPLSTLLALILIVIPSAWLLRQLILELYRLFEELRLSVADGSFLGALEQIPYLTQILNLYPFLWVDLFNGLDSLLKEDSLFLDPSQMGQWATNILGLVQGGIGITFALLFNLVLAMILLYCLFRDGHKLYLLFVKALPFPKTIIASFINATHETLKAVVRGNLFIACLQGSALALAFFFLGFDGAISYGVMTAIFSVVPIVGTSIVWVPASCYLIFVEDRYLAGAVFIIYSNLMFFVLENILKPKLLDAKLGLHPILLFFAVLGGVTQLGISGIILGPFFLALFRNIWLIYHELEEQEGEEQA